VIKDPGVFFLFEVRVINSLLPPPSAVGDAQRSLFENRVLASRPLPSFYRYTASVPPDDVPFFLTFSPPVFKVFKLSILCSPFLMLFYRSRWVFFGLILCLFSFCPPCWREMLFQVEFAFGPPFPCFEFVSWTCVFALSLTFFPPIFFSGVLA